MNLEQYLQSLKGKRVAVLGIGVSNRPLIELLLEHGIDVTACDKSTELGDIKAKFAAMGAKFRLGQDYLEDLNYDVIFRTPGLHPNTPQITAAVENGSELTSEMEVFFEVCPCRIIAVTGSDGKTTTTTLISEMLKQAGKTVFLGGNIGMPLLSLAPQMKADDFAVLELSSFQLMTMRRSPEIAVVTNAAPNHLDVHKDMAEYVAAKENVYLHQSSDDITILNLDNDISRAFAEKAVGNVRFFSRRARVENGVYLENGEIYYAANGESNKVLNADDIRIPGTHNVENYMAAIAAVYDLVGAESIVHVAKNFGGVEHRIELVREKDGVRYYNDSIASSPSRTIAGLRSFSQKLILIAGGYDKHIPFDELGTEITERVKKLYLTGHTAELIRTAVVASPNYEQGKPDIELTDDFKEAVLAACAAAEKGDVVIMSPACASFDKFKNFAERGNAFKDIINSL